MQRRKLITVIKDLALAFLNATLILIAICLWLAWQLSDTVSSAASEFAASLVRMQPLRDDVLAMTTEIASLRTDLAAMGQRTGEVGSQAFSAVEERVETLEVRVSGTLTKMETLVAQPDQLIDYAIDQAAISLKSTLSDVWQCGSRQTGASPTPQG